jgi:hypothetical protein
MRVTDFFGEKDLGTRYTGVCDKASFSFKATTRKKKKKQQKGRDDGVGSKEGVECRVDRVGVE